MKRPLQRAERPQRGSKGATGGIEPWTCSTPCAQDTSPHSLRKLQACTQCSSNIHQNHICRLHQLLIPTQPGSRTGLVFPPELHPERSQRPLESVV